jgi:anti-sigma B factor antagonist
MTGHPIPESHSTRIVHGMDRHPLAFHPTRDANESSLAVAGEIDMSTADSFFEQARALIDAGTSVLVLDLGEVTFCDSLGVAALVRIYKYGMAAGCRIRLVNLRSHVAHILEISGLDQVFEVEAA